MLNQWLGTVVHYAPRQGAFLTKLSLSAQKQDTFAGSFNDLHCFDARTMRWTQLAESGAEESPSTRIFFSFAAVGGRLYVFGGNSDPNVSLALISSVGIVCDDSCYPIFQYLAIEADEHSVF